MLGVASTPRSSHKPRQAECRPVPHPSSIQVTAQAPDLSAPRCLLAATHQRPEDIDGEEGNGEGDQPQGLQMAVEPEVVLGPPQAQPA